MTLWVYMFGMTTATEITVLVTSWDHTASNGPRWCPYIVNVNVVSTLSNNERTSWKRFVFMLIPSWEHADFNRVNHWWPSKMIIKEFWCLHHFGVDTVHCSNYNAFISSLKQLHDSRDWIFAHSMTPYSADICSFARWSSVRDLTA